MIRYTLAVIFVICSLTLTATSCNYAKDSANDWQISADTFSLQGDWRFSAIGHANDCGKPVKEEYFSPFGNNDIHISHDTICFFLYPCALVKKWKFQIRADSLIDSRSNRSLCKIEMEDSIMRFVFDNCVVQTFVREAFDSGILRTLINDSVNPGCLVGKMKLSGECSDIPEEQNASIVPVRVPSSITVSSESDARIMLNTKSITIRVRGRKRLFYVTEMYWEERIGVNQSGQPTTVVVHRISLSPGSWWKGQKFTVQYCSG